MGIRRREFLTGSLAGVGAVLAGCRSVAGAKPKARTFDPYEKVSLGKTGLTVTRVGLGTGVSGGRMLHDNAT